MADTTVPSRDQPTGTTVTQLANTMRTVRELEQLRIVGILRRYPARYPETTRALWEIEREILRGPADATRKEDPLPAVQKA